MHIDSRIRSEQERKRERGFTIIQVLVTVALIAIVSTFGIMGIASARASFRLSGAARELAGYLEKARTSAIRRNDTTSVTILNANSYSVTLDSDGDGTSETRTVTLPSGVFFDGGSLGTSAVFDWRGRVPNQLGIVLRNNRNGRSSINLSGSGDVTLDDEIFQDGRIGDITLNTDVPPGVASPTPYGSPTATPYPTATATPTSSPAATPTPLASPTYSPTPSASPAASPTASPSASPAASPSASPAASPAATPIACSLSAPSTLTLSKNGHMASFSISVANANASVISASGSGTITGITPGRTTVTGGSTIVYTVTYDNGSKSGVITITSACGNKTIAVTVD